MTIKNIAHFENRAVTLQRLLNEALTNEQILDVAQEASLIHHQISAYLLNRNLVYREEFVKLAKLFSSIESSAIRKFHKPSNRSLDRAII